MEFKEKEINSKVLFKDWVIFFLEGFFEIDNVCCFKKL